MAEIVSLDTFADIVYKDLETVVLHLEETPPAQRDTFCYHRTVFYVRQLVNSLRTGGSGPEVTPISPLERRLVLICSSLTNLPKE